MNISYNWLKDYLGIDLQPEEVSAALTSIGLETGGVEEVQSVKGGLKGLVIGHVLTCRDHENSDHLHVTTVDLGDGVPTQIVCGAANVAAGQKVVVATVGTILYNGDESFTIKKSKIRGEESNGMICAEDEIGLGESHDGIMVLPETAVAGTPAAEYFNIQSDYVLEVDITPNRVDAASHFGVARDLAAYLKQNGHGANLQKPNVSAFALSGKKEGAVKVRVENSEACPRYSGVTIEGVTVKESPEWLKNRLISIGLRPINNIVDVTNYILHELGQPLHCFDRKEIAGGEVVVRTTAEGTKFVTLDGAERTLSSSDLMICNTESPMCIAGVFGGLNSGVTFETKDVFLESAYFSPLWVRKTARRHGLNTDSSFRYERGCDPNNTLYVLKRAALMIQELAGGEIVGDIVDIYPNPIAPAQIEMSYEKVNSLIGKEIERETVLSILDSLEIEVLKEEGGVLTLQSPTYRVDVQRDVDVIEDILRIYGYNNVEISHRVNATLSNKTKSDVSHKTQNIVSEQLVGAGFNEILNNSLTKGGYYSSLETYPASASVELLNPLSSDLNVMRQTLLFGGLESIAYNRNRKNSDLQLFEFGNCYQYDASKKQEEKVLAPYSESAHLGLWICGNKVADSWAHTTEKQSVYVLKAHVENIFTRVGISKDRLTVEEFSNDIFASGLRYLTAGKKTLAEIGVIKKSIQKAMDIDTEVFYGDIHWDLLMKESAKKKVTYAEMSKYPAVRRDLALLVGQSVSFDVIRKIAVASEKKLLKEVSLFDVYEGKNLPEGTKSYAVSFLLQDEEKTLNDKQIETIMTKILSNIQKETDAKLR